MKTNGKGGFCDEYSNSNSYYFVLLVLASFIDEDVKKCGNLSSAFFVKYFELVLKSRAIQLLRIRVGWFFNIDKGKFNTSLGVGSRLQA